MYPPQGLVFLQGDGQGRRLGQSMMWSTEAYALYQLGFVILLKRPSLFEYPKSGLRKVNSSPSTSKKMNYSPRGLRLCSWQKGQAYLQYPKSGLCKKNSSPSTSKMSPTPTGKFQTSSDLSFGREEVSRQRFEYEATLRRSTLN